MSLCQIKELTLSKTLEVAQRLEAAEKSSKVMQEVEQKPLVTVQRSQNCYRCGGQHIAQTCFSETRSVMYVINKVTLQKCVGVDVSNSATKNRTQKPHMQTHYVEDNNATR